MYQLVACFRQGHEQVVDDAWSFMTCYSMRNRVSRNPEVIERILIRDTATGGETTIWDAECGPSNWYPIGD